MSLTWHSEIDGPSTPPRKPWTEITLRDRMPVEYAFGVFVVLIAASFAFVMLLDSLVDVLLLVGVLP